MPESVNGGSDTLGTVPCVFFGTKNFIYLKGKMKMENITKEELKNLLGGEALSDEELEKIAGGDKIPTERASECEGICEGDTNSQQCMYNCLILNRY